MWQRLSSLFVARVNRGIGAGGSPAALAGTSRNGEAFREDPRRLFRVLRLAFLAAAGCAISAVRCPAATLEENAWTLGPFVRQAGANPVLLARTNTLFRCPTTGELVAWESENVLATAAAVLNGQVCLVYRAEPNYCANSRCGLAKSDDGLNFQRLTQPALFPDNDEFKSIEQPHEKEGATANVIFIESMVRFKRRWFLYYGAPDRYVCVATCSAPGFEPPLDAARRPGSVMENATHPLPPLSIRHLQTLTDNTGIHEFARGTVPWHENGYCAEDVARALAAVTLYEQVTGKTDGRSLARVYFSYLNKSTREDGQIWNRKEKMMTSGDSYGRVLYGLGYAASFHPDPAISKPAGKLFERLLPCYEQKLGDYPSARACAIQGLAAYMSKHQSAAARSALLKCAEGNLAAFEQHSSGLWKWFGDSMTYDTGRLPLVMLLAFQATGEARFRQAGLDSLDFLLATCFPAKGTQLSLVGNKGWDKKEGTPARFDQQPIDAASVVEACVLAWRLTGEAKYSQRARTAFDWFLGNNVKQAAMYDPVSAGCHDGLTESGPNPNQGAESNIMYVIARCTIEQLLKAQSK